MCTPSPGLVGDFLRDGSLPRALSRPNPIQLCADLIESPIQIQCSRGYLVATRAVGKAGLPFLVSSRIEEDSYGHDTLPSTPRMSTAHLRFAWNS